MYDEIQQVQELITTAEKLLQQSIAPAQAIASWIASDDDKRQGELLPLLDAVAIAAVQTQRMNDSTLQEGLASELVELRVALAQWPVAASMPPISILLGCLQALLRGEADLLAAQRTRLDEGLAGALRQIEGMIAAPLNPDGSL